MRHFEQMQSSKQSLPCKSVTESSSRLQSRERTIGSASLRLHAFVRPTIRAIHTDTWMRATVQLTIVSWADATVGDRGGDEEPEDRDDRVELMSRTF